MKKVLLSAVALLTIGFANAQEEAAATTGGFAQGDVFVSGAFAFGSESTGDAKTSGFEIEPRVGYFMSENIAIGGKLGYMSMTDDDGFSETKFNALSVGAFGRYYATPGSQFSLFAELGADYTSEDYEAFKVNGFGVNLGAGLSYFVSSNFAIEAGWAGLGYNSMKADVDGAEATNTFGLMLDMRSINFGLVYKF